MPEPIKPGVESSTYKMTQQGMIYSVLLAALIAGIEAFVKTLPPTSWMAPLAPIVLSALFGILRTRQVNNARDNEASVQVAEKTMQVPEGFTLVPLDAVVPAALPMQGVALGAGIAGTIERLDGAFPAEETPVDSQ